MRGSDIFGAAHNGDSKKLKELLDGAGKNDIEYSGTLIVDIDRCRDARPLMVASNEECIKLLLEAGADINSRDRYGWTPLHWMSKACRISSASVLLDAGADIDSVTYEGITPLMLASCLESGCNHMVMFLIQEGANVDLKSNDGKTASELSFTSERFEAFVRPEIVKRASIYMHYEVAEICGDYCAMTPERRKFYKKLMK